MMATQDSHTREFERWMVPGTLLDRSSLGLLRKYLDGIPVFPSKWILSLLETFLALRKAFISVSSISIPTPAGAFGTKILTFQRP